MASHCIINAMREVPGRTRKLKKMLISKTIDCDLLLQFQILYP